MNRLIAVLATLLAVLGRLAMPTREIMSASPESKATPANGSTTGPAPEINGSNNRISTGDTLANIPRTGTSADTGAAKRDRDPEAPTPSNEALTRANTGSGRNPQIPQIDRLQNLETPGRVGSGRVGSGRAAAPLDQPRTVGSWVWVGTARPGQ